MIGIALVGVVLALAVQAPCLLVAVGDSVLIGFGVYKLVLALRLERLRPADEPPWPPAWFGVAMALLVAVLALGLLIGWLYSVISY
jgi:hypothetical protein